MYSGGLNYLILRMKVKYKEKLNYPLKGWQILSAISSMYFHTVHWVLHHHEGFINLQLLQKLDCQKPCWDQARLF